MWNVKRELANVIRTFDVEGMCHSSPEKKKQERISSILNMRIVEVAASGISKCVMSVGIERWQVIPKQGNIMRC